jgi:hypothetical protein
MTTDVAIWVGAGFTILGALIGAGATLVASHYARRWQHFNDAAAQFRAAFVDTIYYLRTAAQDVFNIITPAVLADQHRALIKFEQFLSSSERNELANAWASYSASPHTRSPGSLQTRPIDTADALANIDALLKFAAPR